MTTNKIFESFIKNDFGIRATDINIDIIKDYLLPTRIRDEIPTLNQFGYMKEELDELSNEFLEYSSKVDGVVLELGTAYGWLVHRALEKNIKIIASDISEEHLAVLLKHAPKDYLHNLYLYPGNFPKEISFPNNSLDAVMSARMFHFLDGDDVESGLSKVHDWLKDNGKFYFSTCSIYHYSVKEKMLATYKEKEASGEAWPGVIWNQREIAPNHAEYVHDLFHVFDMPQLQKLFPKHGFEIEKINLFDYPSDTYSENKEGHIGLVARKI